MGTKVSLGTPSNLIQTIVLTGELWNLSREIQFHIQLPVQKPGTADRKYSGPLRGGVLLRMHQWDLCFWAQIPFL